MKLIVCIFVLLFFISGCAINGHNPDKMQSPEKYKCIEVIETVKGIREHILNGTTVLILGAGTYVTERVDKVGTYYRGPSGAIFLGRDPEEELLGVTNTYYNGGLFIPHDNNVKPMVYTYFLNKSVEVASPEIVNCSLYDSLAEEDIINSIGKVGEGEKLDSSGYVANQNGLLGNMIAEGIVASGIGKISRFKADQYKGFNEMLEKVMLGPFDINSNN